MTDYEETVFLVLMDVSRPKVEPIPQLYQYPPPGAEWGMQWTINK